MTVWKFILQEELGFEPQPLMIPEGGEVVHVREQGERVCLWIQVDEEAERVRRWFRVLPTGIPVPEDEEYLGTAHLPTFSAGRGEIVLHVFELQR